MNVETGAIMQDYEGIFIQIGKNRVWLFYPEGQLFMYTETHAKDKYLQFFQYEISNIPNDDDHLKSVGIYENTNSATTFPSESGWIRICSIEENYDGGNNIIVYQVEPYRDDPD